MFGFRWLKVDSILSHLVPNSDRCKSDRNLAYRAMLLLAEELLSCGQHVMLDATYASSEHRLATEILAAKLAAPLFLIEFHISPEAAVSRFKNRSGHQAIDLTEIRVRDLANKYPYSELGLTIMAEQQTADVLPYIDSYLRRAEPLNTDGSWSASAEGYTS